MESKEKEKPRVQENFWNTGKEGKSPSLFGLACTFHSQYVILSPRLQMNGVD